MKQPKNITVKRIYEPNMQAMVHALRLVLEYGNRDEKTPLCRSEHHDQGGWALEKSS